MHKPALLAIIYSSFSLYAAGQNCLAPAEVHVADTTSNSITLTWSSIAGTTEYNYHLTVCAPPFLIENSTQDTFVTFPVGNPNYLEPCACHRFKVHVVCPDGGWAYSPEITFQTPCAVATNEPPIGAWRVFPNPSEHGTLYITGQELPDRVIFRDVSGRVMPIFVYDTASEIYLKTEGLASGFYILELTKGGRAFFEKILLLD